MNIEKEIKFNPDKPSVLSVLKTDSLNLLAVGLLKDQILKKHKTQIPTLLTVLKGFIPFHINNKKTIFNFSDTYQIPVNTEHEVRGIRPENIFTLTQEK